MDGCLCSAVPDGEMRAPRVTVMRDVMILEGGARQTRGERAALRSDLKQARTFVTRRRRALFRFPQQLFGCGLLYQVVWKTILNC